PFANHNGGGLLFGPRGGLSIGVRASGRRGHAPAPAAGTRRALPVRMRSRRFRLRARTPGRRGPSPHTLACPRRPSRPRLAVARRHPWRSSFDGPWGGGTGGSASGGAGQNAGEGMDYEPAGRAGRNYGWRNREGANDSITSRPPLFLPLVDPVLEYDHDTGQ